MKATRLRLRGQFTAAVLHYCHCPRCAGRFFFARAVRLAARGFPFLVWDAAPTLAVFAAVSKFVHSACVERTQPTQPPKESFPRERGWRGWGTGAERLIRRLLSTACPRRRLLLASSAARRLLASPLPACVRASAVAVWCVVVRRSRVAPASWQRIEGGDKRYPDAMTPSSLVCSGP